MGGALERRSVWIGDETVRPLAALALIAGSAGLVGCGGGEPATDAGRDGGVPPDAAPLDAGERFTVADPEPASLPDLGPCPEGFRSIPADAPGASGVARCEPWPASGRAACPLGEAHFVGEPGCAPLAPCGVTFADGLDDARTVFVDPAAGAGGDGSRAAPFARIADALSVGDGRSVVALARGTYDERVVPDSTVSLVGACAADTVLSPAGESDDTPVVDVESGAVTLSGLSVQASHPAFRVSGAGTTLVVDGVAVVGARRAAFEALAGAMLELEALSIADTAADATGRGGHALLLSGEGTTATVSRAVFARSRSVAVSVIDGAELTIDRAAVVDTESEPATRTLGRALYVQRGGAAFVDSSVFEGNRDMVLRADDAGSRMRVVRSLVRGTRTTELDSSFGFAVAGAAGATVDLEQFVFADSSALGIAFQHAGTTATLRDVVLERVAVNGATLRAGYGLDIKDGVVVDGERVAIFDATVFGVRAEGPTSLTTLRDLVVERPRPNAELAASGVGALGGAHVSLTRARLSGCTGFGLGAAVATAMGQVSRVDADDLVIEDVQRLFFTLETGEPVDVAIPVLVDGAEIGGHRWHLVGGDAIQLALNGGARLELEDARLTDAGGEPGVSIGAAGIVALDGFERRPDARRHRRRDRRRALVER